MARELAQSPTRSTAPGSAQVKTVEPSVSLVPFLFGMTGLVAMPGTVLIHLLTDLGLTESAARTLLARMRASGSLSSTRVGRRTQYRLIGPMRAAFDRIRRGQWTDPVEWNGSFHAIIYWVPERDRAFRDQLRTMTMRGGYATLRPGLLINPRDAFGDLHSLISAAPPEAYVVRAKVELSFDDARETARRAWSLDGLGNEYRAVTRALTEAVDRAPHLKPIAATVFDYHAHLRRLTHLQLHDPGLPGQLLPTDWPVEGVFQARRAFIESWGQVVAAYVYQTIIDTGTLEIAQFDQTVAASQYAFIHRIARKRSVEPRSR